MSRYRDESEISPAIPPMPPEAVDQLVVHMLRNPQVLSYALKAVEAGYFKAGDRKEAAFRILWPCIVAQNKVYGPGLVPYDGMYVAALDQLQITPEATKEVSAYLIGTPDLVEADVYDRVGIIYHAYKNVPADELNHKFGMEMLRRFLQERAIAADARLKFANADILVPDDIEAYLFDVMARMAAVKNLGGTVLHDMSDPDILVSPVDTRSTGLDFFDSVMDGGHAPGEVYVVMGMQKGGKTQFSVQLTEATARLGYDAGQRGDPPFYAYLFVYEEEPKDLYNRFYALGAEIMRPRLNYEIRGRDDFSTTGNLRPYEVEMYSKRGEPLGEAPGEWERLQAWKAAAGKHARIVDMTRRTNPGIGGGGLDEIVSILNAEIAEGRRPGIVVIDYLNVAVSNMMETSKDVEFQREHAIKFVVGAAAKVASPFSVPVWIFNQFDAPAQKKKAGTRMSTADGAEVKTLGANANFAFAIGNRDPETEVAIMVVDRARRSRSQGKERHLYFDGDFARWVDVTGQFDVNSATGSISSKVQGAIAVAHQPPTPQAAPSSTNPFDLEGDLEVDSDPADPANW